MERKVPESWITQKKNGKIKGKLLQKMKRSPEERHTQTHKNLVEIF